MKQLDGRRNRTPGFTGVSGQVLVGLAAAAFLLPKLALLSHAERALWSEFTLSDVARILAQDVLVMVLVVIALDRFIRHGAPFRAVLGALLTSALLALLFMDLRVRELWFKPLDLDLVLYALENQADLASGNDLFWRHQAGWGLTFRKLMALALASYALLYCAAAYCLSRSRHREGFRWPIVSGGVAVLVVLAATSPRYAYSIEANPLVDVGVERLRAAPDTSSLARLAANCDVSSRPLAERLAGPRLLLADAKPFDNLVVYALESVRWQGLELERGDASRAPVLARLAEQGLLAKTYVSLPHSSKSYYAMLAGRHPFPGIEMQEAVFGSEHSSVVRSFARERRASTHVFSSAFLGFENIGGLLGALGFEERLETKRFAEDDEAHASSFGVKDELLLGGPADWLAAAPSPFAAMYIPLAPHYPYDYPGKPDGAGSDLEQYHRSLAYADALLGRVLDELRGRGLLENTLVVLVGDHGESFGEHGSFVHNNSLYEEEITVPMLFWSEDGRLRHDEVLTARQIDLAPTAADLLGLASRDFDTQGVSLLRAIPAGPAYAFTFFDGVSVARVEGSTKHLYLPSSGQVTRFDLADDPGERRPIAVSRSEARRIGGLASACRVYQQLAFAR